jgi:hypothetical protein
LILTAGDITKRDSILWGYTIAECKPYVEYRVKDTVIRELVLNFLGVKGSDEGPEVTEDSYCRVCKAAKKDKCETCPRSRVKNV